MAAMGSPSCLLALALAAAQGPQPVVHVRNPGTVEFDGVLPVSVPWPRGALKSLQAARVGADVAPVDVLMRWPDQSVAVAQLWVRVRLAAGEQQQLLVEPVDTEPAPDDADEHAFEGELALRTVVVDPWGREYCAAFEPDRSAGPAGVLRSGPRFVERRFAAVHRAADDAEATFLGVRAYLRAFRSERRAELTLLLDADPNDSDRATGPVRFRTFALESLDPRLRFVPRFAAENLLRRAEPRLESGELVGYRQELLGPSDSLYLGDRTAKAFRFDLFADGPEVPAGARARARTVVAAAPTAFADLDWVRTTRAFGAHGGPAPVRGDDADGIAAAIERQWRQLARFGPFGDFGDPADAAAQGTPRNGPCALHDVLRWRSAALLRTAEAQVLQQSLRPTPGFVLRLPAEWTAHRQGLSARAIARPHGFTALDYEHFSVDLLFDWFWLTGDPFARDELARAGVGLERLLRGLPFKTARGEGWSLQGGVLIARALGDGDLLGRLRARAVGELLEALGGPGTPFAIRQPAHTDAFGPDEPFDAPWQMAALVRGLAALHTATGDEAVRAAAVAVAEKMATTGWVDGVGPKYFVSALDPTRYRMPVGFAPTEGTARMEIDAFVLARELGADAESTARFADRIELLTAGYREPPAGDGPSDRWLVLWLDRGR
jgi:hypothetical protein